MKKALLITVLVLTFGLLNAQIVFEENFQDQAFPEGTIFYDVDGRTDLMIWPDNTIEDMMNWYVYAHYAEPDNYNAWSTGFSSTFVAGPVDNWFIFPPISIPPQSVLYYDVARTATAYNNPFSEFIQVLISTTGTDIASFGIIDEFEATSNNWNMLSVLLDEYAGQSIYLAFRNYGEHGVHMILDNISVVSQVTIIDDVEIVDAMFENFYLPPGTSDLTLTLRNLGTSNIESIDVGWSIDGGATYETTTLTGLNVGYNETYQASIPDFINISETGGYEVLIQLSNPNGNIDPTPENNTLTRLITIINNTGARKIMLEEFTGAWCGFCPRGAIVLRELLAAYPEQLIGLAYHEGDPMEITEFIELTAEIPMLNGFPSGSVDRFPFKMQSTYPMSLGTEEWEESILERMDHPTPINIAGNITYDETTREFNVSVKVDFVSDDIGEFRINCIIVESGITGYPQINYYNDDPTSYPELYQAGNPIANWEHNHVVRAMLGGAFGEAGIIPYEVVEGDSYTHAFTYVIPDEMVAENINIVIYVSKHPVDFILGRNILNANEYHLNDFMSGVESYFSPVISIYPNPSSTGIFEINNEGRYEVIVHDITGRLISSFKINGRKSTIDLSNQEPGMYFINLFGEENHRLKVVIK